jgi:drug/metabolite transporter (DMT)-like permease
MPASAFFLALAAASLHAVWNLLLARARDPEAATAVALCVGVGVFALPTALTWSVESGVWPFVGASAAFEIVYIALLGAAYRRAELSFVYPISRGVAPVLVLVVGTAALGARTSIQQALGVCLVALGVLLVRGPRGAARGIDLALALGIAGSIAGYTLVDNGGIERAGAISYLELVMIPTAVAYGAGVLIAKGPGALRAELNPWSAAAGLLIFVPYSLYLVALRLAAAAPVAAVRETSIVIATALAAVFLGERVTPLRFAGAAVVVAGVVLVGV